MSKFANEALLTKLREKIRQVIGERLATHYAKHKSAPGQADLFADTDPVASKGGQEKGKWTQTQIGTKDFEKKHPRDRDGQFTKKVGQANLMLWGADGDPTPESQGAPQQSGKISTPQDAAPIDKNKAHDIHVDAREHALHTLQKKLHGMGLAKEAPKHPAPINTADLKKAAGFGDEEGLLLFRHGDTLRAHGEDAKKLAEVNGGNSHISADSLEKIGAALRDRGHKLAIASKPGSGGAATAARPAEPPKTPAQEIGATAGKEMAAKLADTPLPKKSPLSKFLPGKGNEYPKPGEPASNGQTAGMQQNPLQPASPPAPMAPAAPQAAPVAPPVQPPAPGPTSAAPTPTAPPPAATPAAPQLTEAEQERAEREKMGLTKPTPDAGGKPAAAATKESKNNISEGELNDLLATAQKMMFSHAKQILNGNNHDAEDAVQDAMLSAHQNIHAFDPDKGVKFSTWLTSIVENAAKMKIRGRKTKKRDVGREVSTEAAVGGGGDSGEKSTIGAGISDHREEYNPEKEDELQHQLAKVKGAMNVLTPAQQELMKERFIDGKSSTQIAQERGIKDRRNIDSLLNTAIAKVQKVIAKESSPGLLKYAKAHEQRNFASLLITALRDLHLKICPPPS